LQNAKLVNSALARPTHQPLWAGAGAFAAEVMPHFQGQAQPTLDAAAWAAKCGKTLPLTQLQAIDQMTKKDQDESGATAAPQ
jgi:limonene 1,2-monooxygenase